MTSARPTHHRQIIKESATSLAGQNSRNEMSHSVYPAIWDKLWLRLVAVSADSAGHCTQHVVKVGLWRRTNNLVHDLAVLEQDDSGD